jgi:hypothetical protein
MPHHKLLYIGDLSSRDASLLAEAARGATSIIEFGVGGSTQIFAQTAPIGTPILSLETNAAWITRTAAILEGMRLTGRVEFQPYAAWQADSGETLYDLVFDDGIDEFRLDFALRVWPRLKVGGKLIFHDTRRPRDFMNVLNFASRHYPEIDEILPNAAGSNLTIVTKREPRPYENWNVAEMRSPLMVGWAPIDETVAYVQRAVLISAEAAAAENTIAL